MSGLYTEADYENSVIELFENMGYTHVYGPDIERDFQETLAKCREVTPESIKNEKFFYKAAGSLIQFIAPLM